MEEVGLIKKYAVASDWMTCNALRYVRRAK
jgi:hypothetical protein